MRRLPSRLLDVAQNGIMADEYKKYMEKKGIEFPPHEEQFKKGGGSTDMGNVSYKVPSLHPLYGIGTDAANHTIEFTAAAKTPEAHRATILAAKGITVTAARVLRDDSFYQSIKKEFDDEVRNSSL